MASFTAPKTILFPDVLKRWSFQKNRAGIWSFLYYRERSCFFFPKIWSYTLGGKLKMIFPKKIHGNMIFPSSFLKRWSFQKGPHQEMTFLVLSGKMVFFSRKHDIFSLGRKWEMTFLKKDMEIWYFPCTRTGVTNAVSRPSVKKKKSKMVLSRKNTPKGDWRSRLTSYKELQEFSVLSWRPLQAFSCIALLRKKPGNVIYRIEVWLLFQFIRLEIFYNE